MIARHKSKLSDKLFIGIILILLIAIGFIWLYNPSTPTPDKIPVTRKKTTTLFVSPSLQNALSPTLKKFSSSHPKLPWKETSSSNQAQIIITDDQASIPTNVSSETIYSQSLTFEPANFQTLFKNSLPDYQVFLAVKNKSDLSKSLMSYLKDSFAKNPPKTTTILAVGDIMLSRHVGTKTREAGDYAHPFRKTAEFLKDADITFANLESPFYEGPPVTEGMVFGAEPQMVQGLELANIDLVSLANNHFGNKLQKGMLHTFDLLKQKNIGYVGAGENYAAAHTPWIKEINGTKFAFLAYTDSDVYPSAAGDNKAGSAIMDTNTLAQDIAAIKKLADVVIISMHSGTEYTPNPNERQKTFAHAAIDAGADLIIGHHPHVVQASEMYKGKLITYSLGNFVFDQMWSTETTQGIAAKYTFSGSRLAKVEFTPLKIYDYSQPYLLGNNQEAKDIITRIIEASNKLILP